jgi:hypothetical protein
MVRTESPKSIVRIEGSKHGEDKSPKSIVRIEGSKHGEDKRSETDGEDRSSVETKMDFPFSQKDEIRIY